MKLQRRDIPFTMVANEVLYRDDLSLKAKGLYAYLFSKPDGWDFAAPRIADECKEERKSILTCLAELERLGLLMRKRQSTGRMAYILEYATQSPKSVLRETTVPEGDSGTEANRHGGESGLVSNTDSKSNTDSVNKKDGAHEATPKEKARWFFDSMRKEPIPDDLKDFLLGLVDRFHQPKHVIWSEVKEFHGYWGEKTPSGRKERWETEKTFEVLRRLDTWFRKLEKPTTGRSAPRGKGIISAVPGEYQTTL